MRKNLLMVLTATILFLMPGFLLSQAPNLGSLSSFALFTSVGTFTNGTGGATNITGNVGTNSGSYGLGGGTLNGTSHVANATSAQAATDLNTAFNSLTSVACGTTIANALGSLTLTPNVYCTAGAATITGTLTLNAQGNPNAVFIIKTGAGLTVNSNAKVNLINSASQCNVYWQVNGALTLANNSIIRGTILANGAIDQQQGSSVFGRALTKTGNVTLRNSTAAVALPPNASTISAAGTTTFCAGGSVVLSGNTGGTWTPGGSTSASITVTTGGTYYVTNTTNCGSITSNSISVTVNPLPTVSVNSGTICHGSALVLNATGADTYSWSPGESLSATNGASVSASPTITTTYSVTGTSSVGCVKSNTAMVTVNSNPVVSVNSATICEGSSAVLTANGANTYAWSPATFLDASTGATVTSSATVTTNYTVTGTNAAGCTSSVSSIVTVNSNPVISVNSATICEGGSVELVAEGALTYSWDPSSSLSATTGATVIANPSSTSNYTVTGTDEVGCMGSGYANVMVVSNPTVSVSSATICEGNSTVLMASGAASYSWTPSDGLSATSGATVVASPTVTTVYTVTGTGGNCSDSQISTVTVNALPVATISADGPTSFCVGGQVVLTAGSETSYLWSNNETTQSVTVTTSGSYSVTVTGTNGCSATSSVTSVIENSLPIISVNSASICVGGSVTLNATGAVTYAWSPGTGLSATTGSSVVADPAISTTYTITGTSSESCVNTTTASVMVVSSPVVSVNSATICEGVSAVLTATGGNSYLWSTGETSGSISVSPNTNISYTVTGSQDGCSASDVAMVTVLSTPTIGASANPASICSGFSSTLTATGASTYSWSTGATGSSTSVSPSNTTNYMVTGTAGNGCSNTASVNVTVISCFGTTQLTNTSCGSTLISLDQLVYFNSVAGATNYRLEIVNNQQPFNVVNTRNNKTTNFRMCWIPGIHYGKTYNIRVSAYVNGVWSQWGPMCSVTTPSVIPSTQFVSNSCGVTLTSLSQELSFDPILGATNYRIEIINAAQPFNVINVRNNTLTNFRLSWVAGIQYNRTYDMRISAYVSGAWQPFGNVCSITTPALIPTTQLDGNSCGKTISALNEIVYWYPVLGATKYRVEIINQSQPFTAVNFRNNDLTSFSLAYVQGTTTGRTYDIRVAPYINGIWGDYGPMCQVTVGSDYNSLRMFQTTLNKTVDNLNSIYPNPNNGLFTIDLSEDRQVEITNILGERLVDQFMTSGQNTVSILDQPDGVYFIRIVSDEKQEVFKIVKGN